MHNTVEVIIMSLEEHSQGVGTDFIMWLIILIIIHLKQFAYLGRRSNILDFLLVSRGGDV